MNQISNRNELNRIISNEKALYFGSKKIKFDYKFRKTLKYEIFKYICLLRKYEYFCTKRDSVSGLLFSKYWVLKVKFCDRKKNKLGKELGFEITPGYTGKNLLIYHQNVIINGHIGDHCILHGNNVIGNKKTGAKSEIPTLGNNVDVGVGAIVIGNVKIADNCIIGAGAVVTKSFLSPGTIIAGVPAKEIGANE